MASALVVGTVASCALTELIRSLIETTRSVRKCKPECRKLEKELDAIKPDVERLERRLGELRIRASNTDQEDIRMVEAWLERLKRAIELAHIEVHRCNSSRLHLDRKLSGKITSMYNEISKIAADRVSLFLHLGLQLKHLVQEEPSQHGAPLNGSSHNYGYGCPTSESNVSPDPSLRNGYDSSGSSRLSWGGSGEESSVHSTSSSGYESSGTALLRLMSQQRNSILQQEDRTRLSMGHLDHRHRPQHEPLHDPQHERRHTIASLHVTQPLPHVHSHHNRPSYPSSSGFDYGLFQ